MTLVFLIEAEQEIAEATAYYEEAQPGLGVRFREEVRSAVAAILMHPLLWRQRRYGHRRVNLPGFPFYVAYVVRTEKLYVVAVSHGARQPNYLRQRLRRPPAT